MLATASSPRPTPWRRLLDSPPGRFVRENKLLTAVGVTGGGIVAAGAADQSPLVAHALRYGAAPLAGAGMALVGAAAVEDALVNDLGTHNLRAAAKISLGTTAALGGTQMAASPFQIPVLDRALTGTLEQIGNHGEAVLGLGLLGGAAVAGRFAAHRMQAAVDHPAHRAANAALSVAAAGASAAAGLGGVELIGRQYQIPGLDRVFTRTVEMLSHGGPAAAAGGALVLAGGGVLAGEAIQNFRAGGNPVLTAGEGMGAVTAGLGGLELVGRGLRIPALEGLLSHHVELVGAAAMVATGAAVTRVAAAQMRRGGLTARAALAGTAGAGMAVGGAELAADALQLSRVAQVLEHGGELTAGIGLGAATLALGRDAVRELRSGEVLNGAGYAAAATATATGSLFATGDALGLTAVRHLGGQLFDHTLQPLYDHVLEPTGQFLFQHPLAGAVLLGAGVAGYAWYHYHRG